MGNGSSAYLDGCPGCLQDEINFLMDNLHLTAADINLFKKDFKRFDIHKDGAIEYEEFCRY